MIITSFLQIYMVVRNHFDTFFLISLMSLFMSLGIVVEYEFKPKTKIIF